MNETNTPQNESQANKPDQTFHIQRVYLKDLSFESPMGAEAFVMQLQPQVNQELGSETKKIRDNLYEVTLKLTLTAKVEDKTVFLIELEQAGLFQVEGLNNEQMGQLLNTVCLQILFPYARETLDAMLTKGSFPALMIPPVNFEALYAQALQANQQKQGEAQH